MAVECHSFTVAVHKNGAAVRRGDGATRVVRRGWCGAGRCDAGGVTRSTTMSDSVLALDLATDRIGGLGGNVLLAFAPE